MISERWLLKLLIHASIHTQYLLITVLCSNVLVLSVWICRSSPSWIKTLFGSRLVVACVMMDDGSSWARPWIGMHTCTGGCKRGVVLVSWQVLEENNNIIIRKWPGCRWGRWNWGETWWCLGLCCVLGWGRAPFVEVLLVKISFRL